tara:strand:- start:713 stop:1051 length:339 start_codon:yes stop_codon:yes gene_type:complete
MSLAVTTWAEVTTRELDSPTVVQFTAPWCQRCAPFKDAIAKAHTTWQFGWLMATLPEAEELQERFGIKQLPAIVVLSADDDPRTLAVLQGTTADSAIKVLQQHCVMVTDDDF